MANLKGTIEFPQGGSSWKTIRGKIEWEETAIDESTSPVRSKVHTKIYAKCGTGGTAGKGWNGYVTVNGTKHSFSSISSSTTISDSYKLLKEYDDWVDHNDDGSKTITISGKVAGPSGTSLEGVSSSGSGTATLTDVPQASTLDGATSGTTDYSPVFTWTPASADFKFAIKIKNGSTVLSTFNISPNTTSEFSTTVTIITSAYIANLIPSANSITLTAELITYKSDGVTQIGSSSSRNFTVTLNSSVKPTASIGAFSDVGGLVPSSWGIFVQGKSKLSFSVSGTPGTGSSIRSYSTSVAGATYSTQNITTGFLSSSGSAALTVTDNRGRTGTASRSYTVYPYSKPSITKATADRCLADGTLSDSGTYLKYSFNSTISSCNGKNSATYQLGYKTKSATSYTYVTINNNVTDIVLPGVTFNANTSYDIQFRVTDAFNEVVYENESIGSGFRLVHYNKNKKAISLGKSSEAGPNEKLLEVALPMSFFDEAKKSIRDMLYPVGSLYLSTSNNSPANFLGGNWTQLSGHYLYAAPSNETAGTTFGSWTSGSTTLTAAQSGIRAHSHGLNNHTHGIPELDLSINSGGAHSHTTKSMSSTGSTSGAMAESYAKYGGTRNITIPFNTTNGAHSHSGKTVAGTTNAASGSTESNSAANATEGHTHSITPPALRVYVWRRDAD